ncbi:glycine/betaine ABC transporter ATP-binding protein [Thioalkalivibrio denitrificans]|uniref:Quaternary amine transport ATP-binding protein n=1 Tax=Thioalkalivibrio denitrificans TaxID=108003 RepID=A0A1V3NKW5_9GAMM|nr:glycine betaine/L-proline ABC transporter ATP-binding protein [Thioalkalivibrio denitrificans]OOG25705.1 glycine/betaine ABC transporter ATP-binding protein [Thioalkalivibrio denitrificans]
MSKIRVHNLTKIFGEPTGPAMQLLKEGLDRKEILKRTGLTLGIANVSFDVEEGEIVVVMGLSGCGKSTLIRCINRLIEPTAGSIEIDGQDIARLSDDQVLELRRSRFGMVFQNFALFPHRTILDNVAFGLEVRGMERDERVERAGESLRQVGLEGWEQAYPSQLSGGMQQRVGLARALAVDPDILLMDEAFSALDPLIRRDMQHELIALQSRVRKTIVFITHDLDEALKLGDRIVLMKDGYVVQTGTPEEILSSPANRYVERFVEDVDKSQVLTAGTVMRDAGAVAFLHEGPRAVLHRMEKVSYSSLLVLNRDNTLAGYVLAEETAEAIRRGDRDVCAILRTDCPRVGPDEPMGQLIGLLADVRVPVAVVDDQDRLLGTIVKSNVLSALADTRGRETEGGRAEDPAEDDREVPAA